MKRANEIKNPFNLILGILILLIGTITLAQNPDFTDVKLFDPDSISTIWTNGRSIMVRLDGVSGSIRQVVMGETPDLSDGVTRDYKNKAYPRILSFVPNNRNTKTIDLSPDGTLILLGTNTMTATLWDAHDGSLIRTLSGHEENVTKACFSPDGTMIITGSSDQTARLWDVQTGDEIRSLTGHTGPVRSVAFSSDSTKAITGGDDDVARIWDVQTGAVLQTLTGHTGHILAVTFSEDGQSALTGSTDDSIILWNASTGEPLRTYHNNDDNDIAGVSMAPSGQYFVSGANNGYYRIWRADRSDLIPKQIPADSRYPTTVEFSPDGRSLLITGQDGVLVLLSVYYDTVSTEKRLLDHHRYNTAAAFSSDSRYVASVSVDNTVMIHDVGPTYSYGLKEGEDGKRTVYVKLTFSSLESEIRQATITLDTAPPTTPTVPVFSAAGSPTTDTNIHFAWTASEDSASGIASYDCQVSTGKNTANVFDGNVGEMLEYAFVGKSGWTYYCRVRSRDVAGNVSGWSDWSEELALTSGKAPVLGSIELLHRDLSTDSLSDFDVLLALNDVGNEPLWVDISESIDFSKGTTYDFNDFAGLNPLQSFLGHGNTVNAVAFSPDDTTILSGSRDGTVLLWNAETGAQIRKFGPIGGGGFITVCFRPDGEQYFGGGYEYPPTGFRTIFGKAWRTLTGAQRLTLPDTSNGEVLSADFSPDGTKLVIGKSRYSNFGTTAGSLSLIDSVNGDDLWPEIQLKKAPTKVRFNNEGNKFFVFYSGGLLNIRDTATGDIVHSVDVDSSSKNFSISNDESEYATCSGNSPVVWNLADGSRLSDYADADNDCYAVQSNPDDTLVAMGQYGGPEIWNKRTGERLRKYTGHSGHVISLVYNAKGTRLLTAGDDHSIILWDARPTYMHHLSGEPGGVKKLFVRLRNASGQSPVIMTSFEWSVPGYNAVHSDFKLYK